MYNKWTDEEIKFLTENYQTLSNQELSVALLKTQHSIGHKLHRLKLQRKKQQISIGSIFDRLTVIELNVSNNLRLSYARCQCTCGKIKNVQIRHLFDKKVKSCGCLSKEIKSLPKIHGQTNSRVYKIYHDMKSRCLNNNHKNYTNYGGRGITICNNWLISFQNFYRWAMDSGYQNDLTIDRIDVNGNYCPENCRWITKQEQARNTRNNVIISAFGETKILSDWAKDERCNFEASHLSRRIKKYDAERAIKGDK